MLAEFLHYFSSMLESGVTGEVKETPSFSIADPANDSGQEAELHVDHHLERFVLVESSI